MIICIPTGTERVFEPNKNGKFDYSTLTYEAEKSIHSEFQEIFNASKIINTVRAADCFNLINKGLVDFIATMRPSYEGTDHYHVPYITRMSHLNIITGYDYNHYKNEIENNKFSRIKSLTNYAAFSLSFYALLFVLLCSFLILSSCYSFCWCEKRKLFGKSNSTKIFFKKLIQIIVNSYKIRTKRKKLVCLTTFSTFLLVTPFCLMFKTNQVIVPEPQFISNWNDLMKKSSFIYYSDTYDHSEKYFDKKKYSKEYDYFMNHKLYFRSPKGPSAIEDVNRMLFQIVDKKAIFLAPKIISTLVYQLFCSWTFEDQLVSLKTIKDENSHEYALGMVFRKNNSYEKGFNAYVRTIESGFNRPKKQKYLVGFEFLGTSSKHIREQLIICLNLRQIETKGSEVHNLDLKLFRRLFYMVIFFYSLSLIIKMIEKVAKIHCNSKKKMMKNVQN